MNFDITSIDEEQKNKLLQLQESYFCDVKSKDISPARLSKTISAFANASGGDIYIGISENTRSHKKCWDGFANIEDANPIIQVLEKIEPLGNLYNACFLHENNSNTYVMQVTISKTLSIIKSTDDKIYIRCNAQNLPVDTSEKIRRLELDKGIVHFENEILPEVPPEAAISSEILDIFSQEVIPRIEKQTWLNKQLLIQSSRLTVAGTLLFTDEPQIYLPKRSAIKVYRYQTSGTASRDTLHATPITIEGCAYNQIYTAVSKVKETIESMRKLGKQFESIEYPEETLHEIITNAVLHRDYSIPTDIQIRIFDNRVEVESPGKLPGYVTVANILESQSARNPKIVRLINKFPNPPNKDVGEGLNTAFEAMSKLRLKPPIIQESSSSVLVIIRHEKLASPEDMVMEYMDSHEEITNRIGRELTGISSENVMKNVFWRLRDRGYLEQIPERKGAAAAWRKPKK